MVALGVGPGVVVALVVALGVEPLFVGPGVLGPLVVALGVGPVVVVEMFLGVARGCCCGWFCSWTSW